MNDILKAVLTSSWVQNLIKNQLSNVAASVAAGVLAHNAGAGYSQSQLIGALVCIGSVALQLGENYLASLKTPKA